MKLCERIHSLRIGCNLTQKELSELINVSVVSIGGWENGTRKPSAEAIVSLSQIFKVTTDYLLGVVVEPEKDSLLLSKSEKTLLTNYRMLDSHGRKAVNTITIIEKTRVDSENKLNNQPASNIIHINSQSTRYIPRYSTPAAAGSSIPLDGDDFEMILVDDTIPYEADFAVGIQGNSMSPYINDGDTVYVKKCTDISIGEIGIFCVDGAMYCKQYFLDDEHNLHLLSANPRLKHTNICISADSGSDVRCYGKVLLDRIELPDYIYDED